ncbi:unnamed protein product [Symbiodinium sp. CCMP2456]|nr:unnamed protein product [Symbiodinium sp. CCMP2456]
MVSGSSSTLARSSTIYTLSEAVELHESVPPDRWCITRADLKHLRQEVQEAIRKGEIRPPDDGKDNFETSDKVFGPSVYTVNTQHIMPVTDRVGKVSWALMMHPDGLECHLFISHAWQEGIFEFISKLLHSWPSTALHAWCCMLANPQNLNIGALLQAPSSSPFALALQASSCVLVLPNRHCSIYTRLWCVYEAYRAHEEGKTIVIGRASNRRQLFRTMVVTAMLGLLGMAVGAYMNSFHMPDMNTVPVCLAFVCVCASISLNQYQCRMILNRSGAFMCGCLVVQWHPICNDSVAQDYGSIVQRICWIIGLTLFLFLEVDRENGRAREQEAAQLGSGFQGSVIHATCSVAEDAARIHEEIGDKTAAVDYAIHVLLAAGMSSETLREVARAGVDVSGAGHAEIALPAFVFGTSLVVVTRIFFLVRYHLHPPWYFLLELCASLFARDDKDDEFLPPYVVAARINGGASKHRTKEGVSMASAGLILAR